MQRKKLKIKFDKVYQFAKDRNVQELSLLLKNDSCIDITYDALIPISELAKKNEQEAVWFLINKFNANLNRAIYGAAQGNHKEFMNELIASGASIDWAVRGAALGGHHELMTYLLERGASKDYAVFGAAQRGDNKTVSALLELDASKDMAICGAALGNNMDLVKKLIKLKANKDIAIQYAAQGGHNDLMSFLLKLDASKDFAVYGAADGGHFDVMDDLLKLGASIDWAVCGATHGGHQTIMNLLLKQEASKDWAVEGAANFGHFNLINQLIKLGASKKWAVMGATNGGSYTLKKENVLRYISHIDDAELRKNLVVKAREDDQTIDVNLLDKAERRNKIMKEYLVNYSQAHSLTMPGVRTWVSQGPQLIATEKMTSDLFYLISYLSFGLSCENTRQLYHAINQNLFESVFTPIRNNFFSMFKSSYQIEVEERQVLERFQQRRILSLT